MNHIYALIDSTLIWHIDTNIHVYQEDMPQLEKSTLENFLITGKECVKLSDIPDLEIQIVLISESKFLRILKAGSWEMFYSLYPEVSGVLHITRVGFNDRGDQALMYLSDERSSGEAQGSLYLLQKENDWRIIDIFLLWIV
ncbi:hypothetical protein BVY01_02165 [bacterium I07]|nr:hypothetical protein BVY01_02165 [bacterium I07]